MNFKYLIGIICVIISIYLVYLGLPAYFFDIFGLIVFSFLLYIGTRIIKKKKLSENTGYILILIAILGLIVESYIVLTNFILN